MKRSTLLMLAIFFVGNAFSQNQPNDREAKQKDVIIKSEVEAAATARLKPLAKLLNSVLHEDGLAGLSALVSSCYYAPKSRGYDCLIMDIGSRILDSSGSGQPTLAFFSDENHNKRVNDAVGNKQYTLQEVNIVRDTVGPNFPKALVDDLKSRALNAPEQCIVIDPDISESFSGECEAHYANGYGIAKGRDVYRGEFKKGEMHGKGQYSHGSQSKWPTQVFRGSYYRETHNGFGVLSIAADSDHPALESFKKYGKLKDGRYFTMGLYSAGQFVRACESEEECYKGFPTIEFPEISDQMKYGGDQIGIEELRRLLNQGAAALRSNQAFQGCFADEVISEYFGQVTNEKKVDKSELRDLNKYLSTKSLIAQPFLYCLRK